MSGTVLRIGYIPLSDAAPLIVAEDKGFAAQEGLSLDLVREVSWSNVRDKLNIGLFDAAHMLTPVAIAASLGIGHIRVPMSAPLILASNGSAITVSTALYDEIREQAGEGIDEPIKTAAAIGAIARDRHQSGREPLTFGMTFPFSSHNYLLRQWLQAGGIRPDEDVQMVVLPPPYMVDSLVRRQVDAFCVGAPWNSVAVEQGAGVMLHFGCELASPVADKVLALRTAWVEENRDLAARLVRAVMRAIQWLQDDGNLPEAARLLSGSERLGVAAETLERTMRGRLQVSPQGAEKIDQRYLVFSLSGAWPSPIHFDWYSAQMVRAGQVESSAEMREAARKVADTGLFELAGADLSN